MIRRAIFLCLFPLTIFGADYSTYIGDEFDYQVSGLASDAKGNAYVTGIRLLRPPSSARILGVTAYDFFVKKLDSTGALVFVKTFGGGSGFSGQLPRIAVDAAGNICVVGATSSASFLLLNPIQSVLGKLDPSGITAMTGFLVKFKADGTLAYSTFLGGTTGPSALTSVAVDTKGDVYIGGQTEADDYPRTPGLPAGTVRTRLTGEVSGAFFAKIASDGSKILYAGAISGTQHTCQGVAGCLFRPIATSVRSIAVDPSGNAYIAGHTIAADIQGTPGAYRTRGIGGFVAKVRADGSGLSYLTLLSANLASQVLSDTAVNVDALTVDASGSVFLTGRTFDADFPGTPGTVQPTRPLPSMVRVGDAYVVKLRPDGSGILWGTFLGGGESDFGTAISLDAQGNPWVAGGTLSPGFLSGRGFPDGQEFLVGLNRDASAFLFSARYPGQSVNAALSVDPGGAVHIAGATGIVGSLSLTSGSRILGIANAAGGELTGRVAAGEAISIYGLGLLPAGSTEPVTATPTNGLFPRTLGRVEVWFDGNPATLLYVSSTQINAMVPGTALFRPVRVAVVRQGSSPLLFAIRTEFEMPEVFRLANGDVAAVNQDGTPNSSRNPAKRGSQVSIWASGTGVGFLGSADGRVLTGPRASCFNCAVRVGSPDFAASLPISYAGDAPGLVFGITQINFRVPDNGNQDIVLVVGEKSSGTFRIAVGD